MSWKRKASASQRQSRYKDCPLCESWAKALLWWLSKLNRAVTHFIHFLIDLKPCSWLLEHWGWYNGLQQTVLSLVLSVYLAVNLQLVIMSLHHCWLLPRVGPGTLPFSPCPFTSSSFVFFTFPFHSLYLFSSFVRPFPFYQNSPTPFPGRRS